MTTIKNDQKPLPTLDNDSGKWWFTVFWVLAWGIVPTLILCGLLTISCLASESSLLNLVVLLFFILPADWICETLGLGTFSILGGTMPGAMWPIMLALAYAYGLIVVLIIRGLWRLVRVASTRSVHAT